MINISDGSYAGSADTVCMYEYEFAADSGLPEPTEMKKTEAVYGYGINLI